MPAPVLNIFDSRDLDADLRRGLDLLDGGGVVVMPTETVYGAAARVDVPRGVERLKAYRDGRAGTGVKGDKPLTVHLADPADADRFLGEVSDLGRRLMKKLWPGPVGLTFDVPADRRAAVAAELNAAEGDLYDADGTITLRCPDHPLASELLYAAGGPCAITMAAGADPDLAALAEQAGDAIDLIFDAGPTRYHKPSTLLRVRGNRFEVVRTGVYDERIIQRLLRTTVLFVCSGNTCRSPMAEGIAKQILGEKLGVAPDDLGAKDMAVVSAGTSAMAGGRATPQAVEALADLGVDLSRHRSQPISVEVIHRADAVFTMGRSHAMTVSALVPSAAAKVMPLDPDRDIEDPIGGDLSLYKDLAVKLRGLIATRLDQTVLR